MKRLVLLLGCLATFACASQDATTQNVKITPPDLEVAQLSGPADQGFPPGFFQVQYAVQIENHSGEPLTLTQLELQPMGGGGPYRLRQQIYTMKNEIPPAGTQTVTFWANAFSTGNYSSVDAYAPVSIRGIATFDSPVGKVRKIFVKVLPQDRSRRGE
jgi:hypothetical protein